ncbi:MAG: type II toxin-antitoxin system RelE/ParE family toxin [Flavobacteriaceae bacterium]|nr:type II toxin-antitoxin system RelE/ParE family toxin [Bacteroidales bacterium]MCK5677631.1 type II toxin-antitoxin system RelE/ParE family toxin [Flavobacteriaceae bacterium]
MLEVEFLDLAQSELDDAFEYYEYQQANLGYRFVQEIYNTLTLIKEYPSAWIQNSEHTRRCLVKSFPYGVIYHKKENIILVVAIANLHKEPNYWAKRI